MKNKFQVIFEDNHILVLDKKPGVLSQGDSTGKPSLVDYAKDFLRNKYNKPGNVFAAPIHRLDKQVSGLILFAKTSKAASRLSEQMRNNQFEKFYLAITELNHDIKVKPKSGEKWIRISTYISRKDNKSFITDKPISNIKSHKSILSYNEISRNDCLSLKIIKLETGKKHQIRAQMSALKMPIIGDKLYDSKCNYLVDAIALYSCFLGFYHPIKKEKIDFFLPSEEFKAYFNEIDYDAICDTIKLKLGSVNKSE